METLICDALKDFDTFKELTEAIPLEVLDSVASALNLKQQQLFQEYSLRLTTPTAQDLAIQVQHCTTWEEIERVIAIAPSLKQEVWALLTFAEKERVKILKIIAAPPIDPRCGSMVGKRVYVTAGLYRQAGIGVVEHDRGYGTLRGLEVRFPNGRIQFCSLSDARSL